MRFVHRWDKKYKEMTLINKQIVCEACIEVIDFKVEDVYTEDTRYFVDCRYCSEQNEILELERFGIRKETLGLDIDLVNEYGYRGGVDGS